MSICACGQLFDNPKELRVHIALKTDRWPMVRCSATHHDPANDTDIASLRWLKRVAISGHTRTFRYVRLADVPAYLAQGWIDLGCLEGTYHGQWSTLMEQRSPDQ